VLRKPGPLDARERASMEEHVAAGAEMVARIAGLGPVAAWIAACHEHVDGGGYPRGLHGDEIPLGSRILHVADAYDAMTSARAYRAARPSGDALRELWRWAGTEFHAEIVGALVNALPGVTSDAGHVVLEHV
jgi:HD-GYP domain-containing protein (c-di-GMP phosphodiesterase class II)